jgi:pimeloyl-ACP methyl ester carboxylesterase
VTRPGEHPTMPHRNGATRGRGDSTSGRQQPAAACAPMEGQVTGSLKPGMFVAVALVVGCSGAPAESPNRSPVDSAVVELGEAFTSGTGNVNGTTLHYVRGGRGPAMILLHGFPQDWSVFRRIMPRLARIFTVVAVDLRGIGGSPVTPSGYDAATLADDIHQLATHLGLKGLYVAGHDNGGMVAYALARLHPEAIRGVMILDVPIPGLAPWEQVKVDPVLWHFGFHQTPNAPERLIAGREAIYFREVFFNRLAHNPKAISDADLAHYVQSYASPNQLRAGLEVYRAYPLNERFNATRREPIDVPIVLAGGEHSMAPLNQQVARSLRDHGWRNLSVEIIAESGHQLIDEQPAAIADLLERYAAR